MMLDVPHGKGTLVFGRGRGGGIQRAEPADRYEGEFDTGFAHGLGQFTAASGGRVFRGEFNVGQRHGCGAEYDVTPFLRRLDAGLEPAAAWAEARPEVERSARLGTWLRDTFFAGPDDSGRWCHLAEVRGTLQEVAAAVAGARMFQNKPDGEVSARMAQDANGAPAPAMQDPLHYPHGTAFLAPGPLGQCHGVPAEPALRAGMARAAANHARIWNGYNLPYEAEPGSVMDKAQRLWKRREARRQRGLDKKLVREAQRLRRLEAAAPGKGAGGASAGPADDGGEAGGNGGGFSDDDLIAFAPPTPAGRGPGAPPPSVFASLALTVGRAAAAFQGAIHAAAVRAPPRRQFSLARPARRGE
jgi:hypothetical protein